MVNFNFSEWFAPADNHFSACFHNVDGLDASYYNRALNNWFGTQEIHSNGVHIGYFNITKIHPEDLKTEFDLLIPKEIVIPSDSSLKITNDVRNSHIEILRGNSEEALKNGEFFKGFECSVESESSENKPVEPAITSEIESR